MAIQWPRPSRGLRRLVKEVSIIVLGVLLALGAQQIADDLDWRHKARDAVEAMRLEMQEDNGPQGFVRIAAEHCYDGQLDAIQAAIEAGQDRRVVAALAAAYQPPVRTWDSDAWNATVAAGVPAHVSAQQMVDWSTPYRTIPDLRRVNAQESADLAALQPLRRGAGPLSANEQDRMLAGVQKLRSDNWQMAHLSRKGSIGLDLGHMAVRPEERRRLLDGLRARYGACVVTPSSAGINPDDQLNDLPPAPTLAAPATP
jgi:hypothetical protein